jgi:sestrin
MSSTSQALSPHSLTDGFTTIRDMWWATSKSSLTKVFADYCIVIESAVKESKPRTERFRLICRAIIRASYLCPVEEVRTMCSRVLRDHRHVFHIREETSPSRFEGGGFIEIPNWSDPALHGLFNPFSHLEWILGAQGRFLELYRQSTDLMMKADGPLPRSWRHFVAMIGASRHNCEYLVRQEMFAFLASGGDPKWLTDNSSVPKKLACLSEINAVMAHRPWALDSSHIEYTVTAGRWSFGELVHALVILATFQSLSSLVFGAGTRLEDDLLTEQESTFANGINDPLVGTEPQWDELVPLPQCFMVNDGAPNLLQRLIQQRPASTTTPPTINVSFTGSQRSVSSAESGILENPIAAFEGFGSLNEQTTSGSASPVALVKTPTAAAKPASTNAPRLRDHEKEELAAIMQAHPVWKCPVSDMVKQESKEVTEYRDFNPKTDATLHTTSFSWEDHGMMVMARQMADLTDCINEENMHAIDFTTNTIGGSEIESTHTVREAIVKYVQRMYGIFHDDYRYDRLNRILPVIHKAYLKKLACFPERLTRVDYMRMRRFEGFTPKDLIHYAHLVSQTRRIASLTWAMKAVMRYQSGGNTSSNSV